MPDDETDAIIGVATYNVNHVCKAPSNDATAREIARCGADIVCLQEVNASWETFLRSDSAVTDAYPYSYFHVQPYNPWGGFACLSVHPIASCDVLPETERGWYPAGRVVVSTPSGLIQVLIVHLRAPVVFSSKPNGGFRADWIGGYFSKEVKAARLNEIQTFCAQLEPEMPSLILGDFNEQRRGGCVEYLEQEAGFCNTPKAGLFWNTYTWSFGLLGIPLLCFDYDYILHSKQLEAMNDAMILKAGGSDHRLVMASFAFSHDNKETTEHTASSEESKRW